MAQMLAEKRAGEPVSAGDPPPLAAESAAGPAAESDAARPAVQTHRVNGGNTTATTEPTTEVVIIGDSMTRVLRKPGIELLTNKSVSILSTGGAVPDSIKVPPQTTTATDVVVHVGTNLIELEDTPNDIVHVIVNRAQHIRDSTSDAKIYLSSIIIRSDLTDVDGNTEMVKDKIDETNQLIKDSCVASDFQFIDNGNITTQEFQMSSVRGFWAQGKTSYL